MIGAGPDSAVAPPAGRARRAATWGERIGYALVAAGATLWVACTFYASMRAQTLSTAHLPLASTSDWSAPLDDVFIHFDFARSIARGHPFEWSEGNGYSSGGTSLLYPFVLAFGYWVGFRKLSLMVWAALVACVCTFALLLGARRLFRELPSWTSYLAPVAVLGIGVLDWSLFSGMEVALLLALWAGALIAWDDLVHGDAARRPVARPSWTALGLGAWGAAMTLTRPEAAVTVGVFAVAAALGTLKRAGWRGAGRLAFLALLPTALVVVAQAAANRILTGESTASGALVKLELHHPHLTAAQAFDAWRFHVKYQLFRVAEYHLTDVPGYGWIPFLLALVALVPRATRRYAAVLWAQAVSWVLVVALNGQVRWQNERYTMPALAWLLLAAALGAAALVGVTHALGRRGWVLRAVATLAVTASLGAFALHHRPRFVEQVWFFGRASRNIRDQHIRAGRLIRALDPTPTRVLVGDAGAIPYAADLPALDIIGLGGYRGMPFARATRQGVAAAIELIERMPPEQRPDLLALYPSWWGLFPLWFGQEIEQVPVTGNVICGGASKVLYRPDWSSLDASRLPSGLEPGEVVIDEIDPGDVINEREHGYVMSAGVGHLEMKLLADLRRPARDLWDAGRIVPPGASERFVVAGLRPGQPARLLLRVAPAQPARVRARVDGVELGELALEHTDGWTELAVVVPVERVRERLEVLFEGDKGERVIHHVWATQRR